MPASGSRWRFRGYIAGLGTAEGTRIVIGHWPTSPFGSFSDVMVERGDGHRILLAPDERVARFVAATYRFDEVRLVPVRVVPHGEGVWGVSAGPVVLRLAVGPRTHLGRLLRLQPAALAESPLWAAALSPVARLILPGVRTVGTAGGGRREWYGARDEHRITAASSSWEGVDLGSLRTVDPPPRFGFSSTPSRPSVVRVVSTVAAPATRAVRRRRRAGPGQPSG